MKIELNKIRDEYEANKRNGFKINNVANALRTFRVLDDD